MLSPMQADAAAPVGSEGTVRGWWTDRGEGVETGVEALREALRNLRRPVCLLESESGYRVGIGGDVRYCVEPPGGEATRLAAFTPALAPGQLGDPAFLGDYGLEYAYVTGAMANAIASVELVEAVARSGMLGSYGAAGRPLAEIENAVDRLQRRLIDLPCAFNLIHSPSEPEHEQAVADLYIARGVRIVEASAYLKLTLAPVKYRLHGIHRDYQGRVVAPNRIIAKVSRVEVAKHWMSPPSAQLVEALVLRGDISREQAELAAQIPLAQDVTAEADSGGHTDNQSPLTLLPTMMGLRDQMQAEHRFDTPLRVGAAGGIGTPAAAAAAFAMGAAYVMTGSVNQACIESGSSDEVRALLADARQADVMMAPAADMFELGVKLQVLKRGTLFPMRATKLYELYRTHDSLDAIPQSDREFLERTVFGRSLPAVWADTQAFFSQRDPAQLERAERSPKHKMGLVFRWYLGRSSEWANSGESNRRGDYQIWCGPAMGAFNAWSAGSEMETPQQRSVVGVALNILYGAAVSTRVSMLRAQGARIETGLAHVPPRPVAELMNQWQ